LSGGELVGALQHRLSEAQSERHVARVGLQVVDDSPSTSTVAWVRWCWCNRAEAPMSDKSFRWSRR